MPILDELLTDINEYPTDNVELELDVRGFGDHISRGEIGNFSVTVRTTDGTGSGYATRDYNDVNKLDTGRASQIAIDKAGHAGRANGAPFKSR